MTKTESKRAEKLNRILVSASELFATSEFHLVCMEEIAQKAGVGKGTLYNLFDSKDDLYFSIIRQKLSELLSLLENTYDGRDEPLKNLRSLIIHLHKFMTKHHHFYRIWKREANTINGSEEFVEIRGLQERIDDLVLTVLRNAEKSGILRGGFDRRFVARFFLGMVDALPKEVDKVYEVGPEVDSLLELLMHGIGENGVDARVEYDQLRHRNKIEERRRG